MRLIFMGTPEFAAPTFQRLLEADHEMAAVYTQPPRPGGRGMAERPSPIHVLAADRGLTVRTPASLRDDDEREAFRSIDADATVVAAYGLLLPEAILSGTRYGAYNVHASLLPRWRGAAPINRAIMAGDAESGVSIMRMERGLDTGPVCLSRAVPIVPGTTAGTLGDRLAALGADLMVEALGRLGRGDLHCRPQLTEGITYAAKLEKRETRIDFARAATEVLNHIHGLSPAPGAWFELRVGGRAARVKILSAVLTDGAGRPGEVMGSELAIACNEGAIRPLILQREGKAALSAQDFLRGTPVPAGTRLVASG